VCQFRDEKADEKRENFYLLWRLHHEQRDMNDARWEGDWRRYQHERREAEDAAHALTRDQEWAEHEQHELAERQWAHHHHHHDWD
jgi:hypothetical protein